jgi:hypothetical protein
VPSSRPQASSSAVEKSLWFSSTNAAARESLQHVQMARGEGEEKSAFNRPPHQGFAGCLSGECPVPGA